MGHREQNSSCPVTCDDEPRGFLTEWKATPLEPTEGAKMGNDEAERLVAQLLSFNGDGYTRFSGQTMCERAAALIRAQAARIADHAETLLKMEELAIARQARAEAAEKAIAEIKGQLNAAK